MMYLVAMKWGKVREGGELELLAEYPGELERWWRGHWKTLKAEEMTYGPPLYLFLDKICETS